MDNKFQLGDNVYINLKRKGSYYDSWFNNTLAIIILIRDDDNINRPIYMLTLKSGGAAILTQNELDRYYDEEFEAVANIADYFGKMYFWCYEDELTLVKEI